MSKISKHDEIYEKFKMILFDANIYENKLRLVRICVQISKHDVCIPLDMSELVLDKMMQNDAILDMP